MYTVRLKPDTTSVYVLGNVLAHGSVQGAVWFKLQPSYMIDAYI
jgi:hypothetical protein